MMRATSTSNAALLDSPNACAMTTKPQILAALAPVAQFAGIAFTQADGLAAWLGSADARAAYADSGFPRYVEEYLGMPREHVTQQLARRIAELALG